MNTMSELSSLIKTTHRIIVSDTYVNQTYFVSPSMSPVYNYSNFGFADNYTLNVLYCQDSTVLLKFEFYLPFVSILREAIEIIWVEIYQNFWEFLILEPLLIYIIIA